MFGIGRKSKTSMVNQLGCFGTLFCFDFQINYYLLAQLSRMCRLNTNLIMVNGKDTKGLYVVMNVKHLISLHSGGVMPPFVCVSFLIFPLDNNSWGQIVCLIVLSLSPSMKVVWPRSSPYSNLHPSFLFHIFTKKYFTFSLSHFHRKISHCLFKIASLALTPVSCSVTNSLTLSPFIVHCVKVLVTGFVRQ